MNELDDEVRKLYENSAVRKFSINFMNYQIREKMKDRNI